MLNLKRIEEKYYINYLDYINLSNILANTIHLDKNSLNKEGYHIRSLYFDNITNDNYFDKISGVENRKKYRIRIYNLNQDPIKLEIKRKFNNIIFKKSMIINKDDAKAIIHSNYEVLLKYSNTVAKNIYYAFTKELYKPVVIIDYYRKAFYYDLNNIRITFDMKLNKNETDLSNLFDNKISLETFLNNKTIILEIKYDNYIPDWIKKLLQTPRFKRCAISKYTLARFLY